MSWLSTKSDKPHIAVAVAETKDTKVVHSSINAIEIPTHPYSSIVRLPVKKERVPSLKSLPQTHSVREREGETEAKRKSLLQNKESKRKLSGGIYDICVRV